MKRFLLILFLLLLFLSGTKKSDQTSQPLENHPNKGVILLTFNGYNPKTPLWSFVSLKPSYLLDSSRLIIQEQVGQYFKDYDVIITTDDSLFYTYPLYCRVRCVITSEMIIISNFWSTQMAGGVSVYNSLFLKDTSAAIVSVPAMNHIRSIADAIAHEVGHTLGLAHQSVWIGSGLYEEYNRGDSLKAPIMGVSYWAKEAVWFIGINGFGQYQDDTAIISRTFIRK